VKHRQVNEVYQAAFAELPIPGHRIHFMLAVLDCFSRYLLLLRVFSEPTAQAMVEGLNEALDEARTMSHLEESRRISLEWRIAGRLSHQQSFQNTLPECLFS
jgi:hypothetical protein